jgi:hypothetical protein
MWGAAAPQKRRKDVESEALSPAGTPALVHRILSRTLSNKIVMCIEGGLSVPSLPTDFRKHLLT